MVETIADEPLKAVGNGARLPAKSAVSGALKEAIGSLGTELLRKELELLCHEHPAIIPTLEARLLVQGKDVVRYHVDTESEDDVDKTDSEESEPESDAGDESDLDRESTKRKWIAVGDEEYTARMATCENCKQEFDVTLNDCGECEWHPGMKITNDESDFWADHDVDCHGPYDAFEDDPDFAEGFIWDCCEKPGDYEGCKVTKHKAKMNLVVSARPPVPSASKKRKVEE